jgi:hypothetical protein
LVLSLATLFGVVAPVSAGEGAPKPIPGGIAQPIGPHLFFPGPGNEPSTIYDFNGDVAIAHVNGTGMATQYGVASPMAFDADLRIIKGTYTDADGVTRQGAFGFV